MGVCCTHGIGMLPPDAVVWAKGSARTRVPYTGTRHWKGLMSTGVAEPYAALTPVQDYRLVLPLNSLRGQHC